MHTDKFGRTWNFIPGHDANQMLRINPKTMWLAMIFQRQARNIEYQFEKDWANGWGRTVDCYLLKGNPLSKYDQWYAGIRFSDEGSDYLSPYFDRRIIEFMIWTHKNQAMGKEFKACQELAPDIGE